MEEEDNIEEIHKVMFLDDADGVDDTDFEREQAQRVRDRLAKNATGARGDVTSTDADGVEACSTRAAPATAPRGPRP